MQGLLWVINSMGESLQRAEVEIIRLKAEIDLLREPTDVAPDPEAPADE